MYESDTEKEDLLSVYYPS